MSAPLLLSTMTLSLGLVLLLLPGLAAVTAPAAGPPVCSHVLFTYFLQISHQGDGEQARMALSDDGQHFNVLNSGNPIPPLVTTVPGTSVRDPFLQRSKGRRTTTANVIGGDSEVWHLVATDGGVNQPFQFSHWSSPDLVHWSTQQVVPILKGNNDTQFLWAPEFVYDPARDNYLVFWAQSWQQNNHTASYFDPACNNTNVARFTFWGTRTSNFSTFSTPELLFDPHCNTSEYAPMHYGDGGIDGDIVLDDEGVFRFFYKDSRAPESTGVLPMQRTSGTRMASTTVPGDLASPWTPPNATLIGLWGSEGPELLDVNGTLFLYFDCSFQPTPPGYPRAPYGVATAPSPQGYSDPSAWTTLAGSCTGNDTVTTRGSGATVSGGGGGGGGGGGQGSQVVQFPVGATHGTFQCITTAEHDALVSAFGW